MEYLHVGLNHFLVLSSLLFGLGLYSVLRDSNPGSALTGFVLMMSASLINILAFTKYEQLPIDGETVSILILVLCSSQFISSVIILSMLLKHPDSELEEGGSK